MRKGKVELDRLQKDILILDRPFPMFLHYLHTSLITFAISLWGYLDIDFGALELGIEDQKGSRQDLLDLLKGFLRL